MGIDLDEQETNIGFSRDEKCAHVFTSDKTIMTKLDKLCERFPSTYSMVEVGVFDDGTIATKTYKINNKKLVSFKGERNKRELTDEQKALYADRIKKMQEARRKKNEKSNIP